MRGNGRKWYKKETYNAPCEPFELSDGSLLEVVRDPDDRHPEALKITRVWKDGLVTTVRKVPATQFSNALYLSIEGDREPQVQPTRDGIAEILSTGRAPAAFTSAVPGQKPGDNYHIGTDREYSSRQEFNQYFKENNLELASPSEASTRHAAPSQPTSVPNDESVKVFDVRRGPPVPQGFEGAKFHYATKE